MLGYITTWWQVWRERKKEHWVGAAEERKKNFPNHPSNHHDPASGARTGATRPKKTGIFHSIAKNCRLLKISLGMIGSVLRHSSGRIVNSVSIHLGERSIAGRAFAKTQSLGRDIRLFVAATSQCTPLWSCGFWGALLCMGARGDLVIIAEFTSSIITAEKKKKKILIFRSVPSESWSRRNGKCCAGLFFFLSFFPFFLTCLTPPKSDSYLYKEIAKTIDMNFYTFGLGYSSSKGVDPFRERNLAQTFGSFHPCAVTYI